MKANTEQGVGKNENEESREVRNFSQKTDRRTRRKISDQIREERRAQAEKLTSLKKVKVKILKKIETQSLNAEEITAQMAALQEELTAMKNTLIGRILTFAGTQTALSQQLQIELSLLMEKLDAISDEKMVLHHQLSQATKDVEKQKILGQKNRSLAMELIGKYKEEQKIKLRKFREKEEKARSVENVIKDHNCLVIHSIVAGNKCGPANSALREGVTFGTKVDILMAITPPLSCSTIKRGDTIDNMWAPAGVLINTGRVLNAKESDMGTKATEVGKRNSHEKNRYHRPIWKKIDDAINRKRAEGERDYNELAIEETGVVALFIDSSFEGAEWSSTSNEVYKASLKNNLPILMIDHGKLYKTIIEEFEDGTIYISKGEEVEYSYLESLTPPNTDERRKELLKEFEKHAPFSPHKLCASDASAVRNFSQGAVEFWKLFAGFTGKYSDNEQISQWSGVNEQYTIEIQNELVKYKKTTPGTNKIFESRMVGARTINLAAGRMEVPTSCTDIEVMIRVIVEQCEKNIDAIEDENVKKGAMKEHATQLLGFATEARKVGLVRASQEVEEKAASYTDVNAIRTIIKVRTGPNGEFKMTATDIGNQAE